jgi:RNA recognition motif-containing protein
MFSIVNAESIQTAKFILVQNLPHNISSKEIEDFFSFCGEINELEINESSALIHFESTAASSTARMLSNARFEDKIIRVSYYFSQFESGTARNQQLNANTREYQANYLVSEWIAKGMLLTNSLIKKGKEILDKYQVIETVEPYIEKAKVTTKDAVNQFNDKYQISKQVEDFGEKMNLKGKVGIAKHYAEIARSRAMENEYIRKANEVVTDSLYTAQATIEEGKKMYKASSNAVTE